MSAVGTISSCDRASFGDNLTPSWRCWITLDDPHAIAETGPQREYPTWCFDLKRDSDTPPLNTGDRVEVSTHGHLDVTVVGTGRVVRTLRGGYDPDAAY